MEFDDYAVSIQEFTTVLGGQKVLDNLSFNIPKNKITTILGFALSMLILGMLMKVRND